MQLLLEVVLPVFLVIGLGYLVCRLGWFPEAGVDGLLQFAQNFALPLLLFRAVAGMNLAQGFDPPLLIAFYVGAFAGFLAGILGARWLFGRRGEDAVAIGFAGMFSNLLLLGLPITERAYGPGALVGNFAILSLHAPIGFAVGVTVMEMVRGRGAAPLVTLLNVLRGMARSPLVVGLLCGFAVNLSGVSLPAVVDDGLGLLTQGALPAALFALGGVLYRYRPEGDLRTVLYVCAVSLVLHPAITYGLARGFALPQDSLRSAVLCAAMAPGANVYLFANMYGAARRVAASAVLIGTALSILTVWGWLSLLP